MSLTKELSTKSDSKTSISIEDKIKELCEFIINTQKYSKIRSKVDDFMADEEARDIYTNAQNLSEELHKRKNQGEELSEQEMSKFEKAKDLALSHPIVASFFSAQQEVADIDQTINNYVQNSLRMGRVPSEEEIKSLTKGGCGCGGNCSCKKGGKGCGCKH